MGIATENNSPFKGVNRRRSALTRKLPPNLAEFLGEFPANPRLAELIVRALAQLKENPSRLPTENAAFALGILTYIYSFPIVELCRILYGFAFTNTTDAHPCAEWNRLRAVSEIPGGSRSIVKTNDLAYCAAALDLSREPVLFHAADPSDRYCSYQFIDAHATTFAHFGTRDKDRYQRTYAIVGPGWRGKLSPDLTWIQSLTHQNLLIGRIGVDGDLRATDAIFSRSMLAPLSRFEQQTGSDFSATGWLPSAPATDLHDLKWFEFASDILNANPPPACESDLAPLFARVGFERGFEFRTAAHPPNVRSGLKRAIPVARKEIERHAKRMNAVTDSGWYNVSLPRRIRENSYIERAAAAVDHLIDPPVDELFSCECRSDENGDPLTGLRRYTMRFERGKLPPTDSFWSVSINDRDDHCFVDKVLELQEGSGSRRLKYGDDGSLEIRIQNTEPESENCNWLRSPRSRFSVMFRGYAPREEIVSGNYRLPAVRSSN